DVIRIRRTIMPHSLWILGGVVVPCAGHGPDGRNPYGALAGNNGVAEVDVVVEIPEHPDVATLSPRRTVRVGAIYGRNKALPVEGRHVPQFTPADGDEVVRQFVLPDPLPNIGNVGMIRCYGPDQLSSRSGSRGPRLFL